MKYLLESGSFAFNLGIKSANLKIRYITDHKGWKAISPPDHDH